MARTCGRCLSIWLALYAFAPGHALDMKGLTRQVALRRFLSSASVIGTQGIAASWADTIDVADLSLKKMARGVVLKNGLRYVDETSGTGAEPKWGDVLQISYSQSVRSSDGSFIKIDEHPKYLIRHGNGRTVRGLDEGLHTMRVGGRRRIEIPPKLGYVIVGLGPLPDGPNKMRRFQRALDDMGDSGAIVFDVKLLATWKDGADLGLYEDSSFSQSELSLIVRQAERALNGAK